MKNIQWTKVESITKKIIRCVIWVIITFIVLDGSFVLISKPDTAGCLMGFAIILFWIYITVISRFFTRKFKFKFKIKKH